MLEGESCDPTGAIGLCPVDTYCYTEAALDPESCRVALPTSCPADFAVIDLNALAAASPWMTAGDTTRSTNHGGGGTCGGGGPNDVYSFTAPAAGTYTFETSALGPNGDSLVFVRSYCQLADATMELACNDDIDTAGGDYASTVSVALEAAQTVFAFVDSYNGGAPSAYTITVSGP